MVSPFLRVSTVVSGDPDVGEVGDRSHWSRCHALSRCGAWHSCGSRRRTTALPSAVKTARSAAAGTPHAQDGGIKQLLNACCLEMSRRQPNERLGKEGGARGVDGMQIHQERSRLQD